MKIYRLLTLLVILLSACVATPPATSVPSPQSTTTPIPPAPSATSTQPIPSATAKPTVLPATPTPPALQQAQAAILPLVAPCSFADQPVSFSPNKTWAVVACQGEKPEDGTTTRVVRMDGSQRWTISFKDAYLTAYKPDDATLGWFLQETFLPVSWTHDEKFVYLAVKTSAESTPYPGYDGLFRLDVSTGKLTPTLKPAIGALSTSYTFQFSPGGTQLAYVDQAVQPLSIVLYNTSTGDEQKITLDARFSQAGSFLWSPNEKQLLVSAFDNGKNGGNSVIVYHLDTMKNEYLVQQSATIYLPLAWVGDTTIYAESYPDNWVTLDTLTKKIKPGPTPTGARPTSDPSIVRTPTATPTNTPPTFSPLAGAIPVEEECINLEPMIPDDLVLSGVWVINQGRPYLENISEHSDHLMPLNGGGLLYTGDGDMAVSPDGKHLAYIDQYHDVTNFRAEKRVLRVIRSSGHSLDMSFWVEDWQWIIGWIDNQNVAIVTAKKDVVILNPVTGNWRKFQQQPALLNSKDYTSWWDIPLYNPTLEWLLERPDYQSVVLKNVQTGETVWRADRVGDATWSANGSTLAVLSHESIVVLNKGIQVANFDISKLGYDYISNPKLSSDGQKLAFNSSKTFLNQPAVLDMAQHTLFRLCAAGFVTWGSPAWSPDDRFVVQEIHDSNYQSFDVLIDTQQMHAYLLKSGDYQHRIAWLAKP